MAVINATAGDPSANSYATIAEANTYHETVLNSSAWDDATDDVKTRALISAARLLDSNLTWQGVRASSTQALDWPRAGAINKGGYSYAREHVPMALKEAQSELARRIIEGGMPDAASDTEGMKSLKAGPVEIEWFEGADAVEMIARGVLQMIDWLVVRSDDNPGIMVPLLRT